MGLDGPIWEACACLENRHRCHCFDALHVPLQPSDRVNVPEPLRPAKRPELLQLKPDTDPPDLVDPFGLIEPEPDSDFSSLPMLPPALPD